MRVDAISFSGARLVYEKETTDLNIWRFDVSETSTQSAPEKLIASTRMEHTPAYSPDGKKLPTLLTSPEVGRFGSAMPTVPIPVNSLPSEDHLRVFLPGPRTATGLPSIRVRTPMRIFMSSDPKVESREG